MSYSRAMCGCCVEAQWTVECVCTCTGCHDQPEFVPRPTIEDWVRERKRWRDAAYRL